MRYDTKVELMNLAIIDDEQGGYEEILTVSDTYWANLSDINMEVSQQLFGRVSTTAINCVIYAVLDLDNNADTIFRINGKKYDLVKSKVFRNKTHLYLEVMDNE